MNMLNRVELSEQVQTNCHISDALFARDYSLCIYLLKMREFYRWEQGIEFGAPLPKAPLGEWLTAREQLWEGLDTGHYADLHIEGSSFEPFASESINQYLVPQGLVYSAGYFGDKPHFFLAELERHEAYGGAYIYIAGRELAREITAPPALSLGSTIFLRRESLRRMIWEKLEEWGWKDPERAIARAAGFYDFKHHFEEALEAMTGDELHTLLQHELGEVAYGRELGPDWEAMLAALPRSRAIFYIRAVRDHLVDCRYTLPALRAEEREGAIHFYMANFSTMRKALFPALNQAYNSWLAGDKGRDFDETIKSGAEHWMARAQAALAVYRERRDDPAQLLQALEALADEPPLS